MSTPVRLSLPMDQLLCNKLQPYNDASRFIVAYSGGADSHALLHALVSLQLPQPILALHVNHGLSPNADAWEQHCAGICEQLGVPFCAEKVRVYRDGTGLENAARIARYDVFARHVGRDDVLLLAHHSDDQLETFFLRVLRGAGVRGMGGMPEWRAIGDGALFRPWLSSSRADIRSYAIQQELDWIEDESNADVLFDRNYLREQVLPLLHARWPQASTAIARSMAWCGESDAVADELAEIDFFACYPHAERVGFSMSFAYLRGLSRARRRNVLRLWLARCGAPIAGHRVLDAIQQQTMESRADATPLVHWGDWECRRYRGRLYIMPQLATLDTSLDWYCSPEDVVLDGTFGELSFERAVGKGMRVDAAVPLHITFEREGLRCRPAGRTHSQSLKKLFQEFSVPPWLRERTPLIYQGEHLLAVGDWWICADAAVSEDETGFVPVWEPAPVE